MQPHLAIAVLAVFAQVGLTLWAVYRMGIMRIADLKANPGDMAAVAERRHRYSQPVRLFENNAHSQFETPQLLYAGVGLAAALGASNWGIALAAVAYVGLRLWHRHIHVGRNRLGPRFRVYVYGLVALLALWVSFGIELVI